MTLAHVLVALAALLGGLLARRAPRHLPVAIALAITVGVSLLRRVPGLPPWAGLGLYLVIPSAGAWCASRVFVEARGGARAGLEKSEVWVLHCHPGSCIHVIVGEHALSREAIVSQSVYDQLKAEVRRLQEQGRLPKTLTREEAIDWAYGNAVLSNPDVTREMVEAAYDTGAEPANLAELCRRTLRDDESTRAPGRRS